MNTGLFLTKSPSKAANERLTKNSTHLALIDKGKLVPLGLFHDTQKHKILKPERIRQRRKVSCAPAFLVDVSWSL